MKPRDRFLKAIKLEEADRVPRLVRWGKEVGQRLSAIVLFVQMREGVSKTDDRIVQIVHVLIQPAPIGLNRSENVTLRASVLERFRQHRGTTVDARYLEARSQQLHGMKARACGDIEYLLRAMLAQDIDKELTFRLPAPLPIDQFIPFVDECLGVLGLIMIALAHA